MISCLIFTKDNANAVINLINLVFSYVDEVVVICSDWGCKREIKYACPNATVHYMPPEGYVEAYYKAGIDSCRGEWIFMLDDDEIPSKKLLRWITPPKHNHNGYLIPRVEANGNVTYIYRLFHKDFIHVTGLIHRGIVSLRKPDTLLPTYSIIHTSKYSAEKSKRYAKIEAKQYPDIIADAARKHKYVQYVYFFASILPRVIFAPNKKDTLIYCWHLFKELII